MIEQSRHEHVDISVHGFFVCHILHFNESQIIGIVHAPLLVGQLCIQHFFIIRFSHKQIKENIRIIDYVFIINLPQTWLQQTGQQFNNLKISGIQFPVFAQKSKSSAGNIVADHTVSTAAIFQHSRPGKAEGSDPMLQHFQIRVAVSHLENRVQRCIPVITQVRPLAVQRIRGILAGNSDDLIVSVHENQRISAYLPGKIHHSLIISFPEHPQHLIHPILKIVEDALNNLKACQQIHI